MVKRSKAGVFRRMTSQFKEGHIPWNKGKSKYGNNLSEIERLKRKNKINYQENKEKILQYQLVYYQKNKEKINKRSVKYNKDYKKRIKLEVINHYSKGTMKCNCCGENTYEFLTMDHENNDGNEHRKITGGSSHALYLWLKRNNYPSGIQVLCMNCNWGRSREKGYVCPHMKR